MKSRKPKYLIQLCKLPFQVTSQIRPPYFYRACVMVAMRSDLWNMWRFEKGWNGWMFNMVPGFSKVVQSVRVSYVTTFFVKVIKENNSNHPILLIKLQDRKSDDSSELIQELIQFGIFGFFWARFPSQCRHLPSGCFRTFSKCCTGTLRNLCLRMLRNSMTP